MEIKLTNIFPSLLDDNRLGNITAKGISDDTRFVRQGDIFFVKERKGFDIFPILSHIQDKVAVFVAEGRNEKKFASLTIDKPVIFVKDVQEEFFRAIDTFYPCNKNDFSFIGITGTKGKTTTAYLIYHLLKQFGKNVSLIGTINYIIGNKVYKAKNTTPDYFSLVKMLKSAKDKKRAYVVMEVSSHGINQKRVKNIAFSRCVFTNLSREHLDYHKTMESYFKVKKSFFMENKDAIAVINIDDPYGEKIAGCSKRRITYGFSPQADLRATNININRKGLYFELVYNTAHFFVKSSLLGRHNVSNILAAIGVLISLGFPLKKTINFMSSFRGVEGRLEEVSPSVFVDYAHTPDSLEKALYAVKDVGYEKVICVFGCGGNRDHGKRGPMGRIASSLADFTFITSDNPRNENPLDICRQIERGFKKKNYSVNVDRKEAIRNALRLKNRYTNCCLLIAGKGHEDYQIIGNTKMPFKDKKIIKKLIKNNKIL